jgi:hypothetical protein
MPRLVDTHKGFLGEVKRLGLPTNMSIAEPTSGSANESLTR